MNDEPTCPYCGEEDQDWWDGETENLNDGSTFEHNCPLCSMMYKVTMCVTTTFESEKMC